MNLIIKIFSTIGSIIGIFFFAKSKGKNEQKNEQLKQENDNTNQNFKIVKDVSNMSFDDKSDFLLSKQRNKGN